MRNVMKKAHEITKKRIRKGDSYKATFRLALSLAHYLIRTGENKWNSDHVLTYTMGR